MAEISSRPTGMRGFVIFWFGQMVSLIGTSMSQFALTIWAYKLTGSATTLALVYFFYITPMLIMSPIAGALVDRSNRKLMMMISDLAAGLAGIVVLVLYLSGRLQVWQLFITGAFTGIFQAFQWPAFSAAITTMVPKEQYGRADGMMSLAETGSSIFGPLLAGVLIGVIGLGGILAIDVASFFFAITTVLIVHVPQPPVTEAGVQSRGSLWKESIFGLFYILKRPSLLGLQIVFLFGNFLGEVAFIVMAPLILTRTSNNAFIFGTVNSVGALGGLVGGLIMSAWGGPKRKVHGVLIGWTLSGLLGILLMGLGRGVIVWSIGIFFAVLMTPLINGCNQAIWQAKVAPDVQGRVFSIRRLIAQVTIPIGTLVGGILAERVMEPAMHSGGPFAAIFSPLVGVDSGAGMSLLFIWMGILTMMVGLGGYAFPSIRDAEDILPDYDLGTVRVPV